MIECSLSRKGITKCAKELVLVVMRRTIWRNDIAVITRRTRSQLKYDVAFVFLRCDNR